MGSLERYLSLSGNTKSFKLFVHPESLQDLSLYKLRFYLCKFIKLANPGAFPKVHDIRKLATSFAFFRSMSTNDICDLVGWSSIRVFKKHYLKQIEGISSSIVCLGREVRPYKHK